MRHAPLFLLLTVLAALPAVWTPAQAQTPVAPQMLYARQRNLAIPFSPDPGEAHRLKQLQLFYSNNQGKSWHWAATAAPDAGKFLFQAESDGVYLLAVQTTDQNGRLFPERMENVTAQMRITIDTVPPAVTLKALPPRTNEVGVAWDIRDDNFDPNMPGAIQLEYRPAGSTNWLPLFRTPGASQHYWNPGTTGVVEVRLKARDLAGNIGDGGTTISLGQQSGFGNPPLNGGGDPGLAGGTALDPNRRYLNSKTISLNYEIKEKGPSGVSGIELWATEDGRSWSKVQLPKAALDPTFIGPLTFEVPREGVYGFTLIARSGVGLSERPPQVGDRPQIWIEVDLTKPAVELQSVLVGEGDNKGKLSIGWIARDKNLGKTPISLSYAQQNTGPWTTFADHLANTGHYIWRMPENMPWQFYLKVEAVDLAGNIGEAVTPGLVKVDLSQPKATIVDVQPGGK
jgi:hypothetical protein